MDVRLRPLPIGEEEFDRLMQEVGPFETSPSLAVALSGGPDSLALALLLDRWVKKNSGALFAVTVDHGLRSESAEESQTVAGWMQELSIQHAILKWTGEKPFTHLQEKARKARHTLLERYCQDHQIQHLFFAHHREDQRETFLLRFLQKSGVDGLCSMFSLSEGPFVRKLRPLLKIPKARLYATLEDFEHPFLEDPSNENFKFRRVQLRAQKDNFEALGMSTDVIESMIEKSSWVRESLEKETIKALFEIVSVSELGYATLDLKKFRTCSFEIARRVLERVVLLIGGKSYGPRWESLIPLVKRLQKDAQSSLVKTLNGVLLKKRHDILFLLKESNNFQKTSLPAEIDDNANQEGFMIWGGRFLIEILQSDAQKFPQKFPQKFQGRFLQSVGKKGVLFLKHQGILTEERRIVDKRVPQEIYDDILATLPALWENDDLLSVPHLDWGLLFWQESRLKVSKIHFFPKNSLAPSLIHVNFMENNF